MGGGEPGFGFLRKKRTNSMPEFSDAILININAPEKYPFFPDFKD